GIDVVFDAYGSLTIGALLAELGIDRDRLALDAQLLVPPAMEAIRATGLLEPFVRARLQPFFNSDAALRLLRRGTPPAPAGPAPRARHLRPTGSGRDQVPARQRAAGPGRQAAPGHLAPPSPSASPRDREHRGCGRGRRRALHRGARPVGARQRGARPGRAGPDH